MTQRPVIQWDDVDINPFRKDVLFSISVCHRDKIFLIRLIPCVRLITSQEAVSPLSTLKPVLEGFQI